MHDPFEHPAIKDYMPTKLKGKTFRIWADEQKWDRRLRTNPFGKSRNKIELKSAEDAQVKEIRRKDQEAGQSAALASTSLIATSGTIFDFGKQGNDVVTFLTVISGLVGVLLSSMENSLPVAVSIIIHNTTDTDAGLINVAVVGYGNKVQAPLAVLSSFNLRATMRYPEDGPSLCYGKILGDFVNVKKDCRKWLTHCCQNHGNSCAKPDWCAKLPPSSGKDFRLIDTADDLSIKIVQVDDVKTSLQGYTIPEYAALSYVWGDAGENAKKLHLSNVSRLSQEGLSPALVARTISDAVKVTKQLGIRYLWVDSFCVIQEDRNGPDDPIARQSQLDQMGSIYGHAIVVIVAAGGEDAEAGLAGITSSRNTKQIATEVRPNINILFPIQYDRSYEKWDTRAWTLQEKLLSKRMLVFDKNSVSFHCNDGVLREDMPASYADNDPPQMTPVFRDSQIVASAK
ncbi:heterokaryon incompatibility protein [Grosmannia clavigera kw1407]|uniref:Heterokaryon incompatibility protein n=1 Tax=Grosmannia clavigera (strain kw1407 / UAMH 11150) TaxID=655863 RepID=F0XBC2_GROCL|nr:heterokaryon incompatibility protein [Grosmannia clavigera kw1407]EFX04862.1 heterokaryon incompatibility protein [Grosmannia clavigera kw1407]